MYLSWSLVHLTVVLAIYTIFSYLVCTKWKESTKNKLIAIISVGIVIFFMAFDFGMQQEYIDRSRFNNQNNENSLERVEVETPNRNSVKLEYITTVNQKKEEMNEEID